MAETEIRPFTAASFNHYLSEKKLMGVRCLACDSLYIPPRAVCPQCRSAELEWAEMSGQGRLAAFTVIYIAPTMMLEEGYSREKPYCSGIVELAEGPKISARILGVDVENPASILVGMPLSVEFVERGEDDKKKVYLAFRA
jgi:hypothetical protein